MREPAGSFTRLVPTKEPRGNGALFKVLIQPLRDATLSCPTTPATMRPTVTGPLNR